MRFLTRHDDGPAGACGVATTEPGSLQGLQLVVHDVEAARAELAGRGVEVSEVRLLGPEEMDGSRFVFFRDPDGNGWAVQQLPPR